MVEIITRFVSYFRILILSVSKRLRHFANSKIQIQIEKLLSADAIDRLAADVAAFPDDDDLAPQLKKTIATHVGGGLNSTFLFYFIF